MQKLEIVEMDVDELVPYAGNAKLHPKEQVQEIAQSILDYGFNDPIAIWHNEQGKPEMVLFYGQLPDYDFRDLPVKVYRNQRIERVRKRQAR